MQVGKAVDVIYVVASPLVWQPMAALTARIAAKRSTFGSGGAVNPLNMRSSAGSLVEGWGVDVREGATPDWEVVDMRAVEVLVLIQTQGRATTEQ